MGCNREKTPKDARHSINNESRVVFMKFSKNTTILAVLFVFFCVGAILVLKNISWKEAVVTHYYDSFNFFSEIRLNFKEDSPSEIRGTNDDRKALQNDSVEKLYFMCQNDLCVAPYSLSIPTAIKKISILYRGFPSAKEDVAFEFNERPVDSDRIMQKCEEGSRQCDYYFFNDDEVKTATIILKNATYRPYGIREIKFYESDKKNIIEESYDFFFLWERSYFTYLFYPILFFVLFSIPGIVIGEFFKKNRKQQISILPFILISTAGSLFLYFLSMLVPIVVMKIIFLIGIAFALFSLLSRDGFAKSIIKNNKGILTLYFLSMVAISLVMFVRDHPVTQDTITTDDFYHAEDISVSYGSYETDFIIPYQSAINFKKGGTALKEKIGVIYNLTDRTPLLPFLFINYGITFGFNFFVYQMFVVMISGLFTISIYYVARLFLNQYKSILLTSFLAFSHFFFFVTLFGPAKTATLFFIFASAYYLLKKPQQYLVAGIFMAAAYLCHPFSLIYFISYSFFIFIGLFRCRITHAMKPLIYFITPTLVIFFLWTIFSSMVGNHNNVYTSVIAGKNWSSASEMIRSGESPSISSSFTERNFWINKLYNAMGLFVFSYDHYPEGRLFNYFKTTIPGVIGITASIFLFFGLLISLFMKKEHEASIPWRQLIIYFVVFPTILALFYQGFFLRMGLMWYILGTIPFILIFLGMFYGQKILSGIIGIALTESFYLFLIHDKIEQKRIIDFFHGEKVAFLFIYAMLIVLYAIFITILNKRYGNHRT